MDAFELEYDFVHVRAVAFRQSWVEMGCTDGLTDAIVRVRTTKWAMHLFLAGWHVLCLCVI